MQHENASISIRIDPGAVFRWVLVLVGLLLVAHTAVKYLAYGADIRRGREFLSIFDLDMEQSFGTWFSSILLLGIGLCLLWIASVAQAQVRQWGWLGIIVIILCCDEVSGMHDRFWVIRNWADRAGVELGPVFHFAWTIPALIALVVMTALYARFLLRLPGVYRNRLIGSVVCYFGGAVGMEMLGSSVAAVEGLEAIQYLWIVAFEETMEMVGLGLGLRAVLTVLADLNAMAEFRFDKTVDTSPA